MMKRSSAETGRAASEGAQLVREVAENDNTFKLQALVFQGTKNPKTWPEYRDAGIADVLIKLVCEREDHGPHVPEFIVPTWNLPLKGLVGIAKRTLDRETGEYAAFREPWEGPTNTTMRNSMARVLRRVLSDRRFKYAAPRLDVADYVGYFLRACDAEWIRSVPEIWEFVWKSWELDSVGDEKEKRLEFSNMLSFVLVKLSPDFLPDSLPAPPISPEATVKRASLLTQTIPGETYESTLYHLRLFSRISRLYPLLARTFLEGNLLVETANAIRTSGDLNDAEGDIIELWRTMLATGTSENDGEAQLVFFTALEAGFMECFSFVATRCMKDDDVASCITILNIAIVYAKRNPVLARRLCQHLAYTLPRMDGYSREAPFPSLRAIGSAYMTFASQLEEIMGGAVQRCAWEQCPKRGQVTSENDAPRNRCSKCKSAHYCGPECQAGDWPMHKNICKKLIA